MHWTLASGAALLLSAFAVSAPQAPANTELDAALIRWRAVHGATWRSVQEPETGFARLVHGGRAATELAPVSVADFDLAARAHVRALDELMGVELDSLALERVVFLPLARAGSSDKMTVNYRQVLGGVRVVDGWVNVLMDLDGRLLSADSTGLPRLGAVDIVAEVSAHEALASAVRRFSRDTGLPATEVSEPELVIVQHVRDGARSGRVAWHVQAEFSGAEMMPEGFAYYLDAKEGSVLRRDRTVHEFDVSGTVSSMASPGSKPDAPHNPAEPIPMAHMTVTSAQGNTVTDSQGNFTIPGATPPLQATFVYDGTFTRTNNAAGADYSLTTTLNSGSGNTVLMNPSPTQFVTAQANSFNWINGLRDWTRAINPMDGAADFLAPSNVNLQGTCNAFFNGTSVNFFRAGGCVNMAYSSIVVHEMGHWLNIRYGSGNGPDGFGEGNADAFALYITDNEYSGEDVCGQGCHGRTGENTRQFCGDQNPGCHGGVHANGEVLMGALWKVRRRLKATLGDGPGAATADVLFNSWLNAYNDGQIRTIIETHWLTLDDDDGNINNGTPNFGDIDGGFMEQGFPGFECDLPTTYCTGKVGSHGFVPRVSWTGTNTITKNDLVLRCFLGVPNKQGIYFFGDAAASLPFQGGTLCVAPPLSRSLPFTFDPFGRTSQPIDIQPSDVGLTRYFQFWFRDLQDPAGFGSGLSDAGEATFCP